MWVMYFVFPGLPFWILLSLVSIGFIWSLEEESAGWLVFLSVVCAAALGIFGELFAGLKWLFLHPVHGVSGIAVWFLAGAIYSIIKWVSFNAGVRRDYYKLKRAFLTRFDVEFTGLNPAIPNELKAAWEYVVLGKRYDDVTASQQNQLRNFNPTLSYKQLDRAKALANNQLKPSEFKSEITTWIIWWPWSAFWTLLNDPIKRIANEIYIALSGIYQSISSKFSASVQDDFSGPRPPRGPLAA